MTERDNLVDKAKGGVAGAENLLKSALLLEAVEQKLLHILEQSKRLKNTE